MSQGGKVNLDVGPNHWNKYQGDGVQGTPKKTNADLKSYTIYEYLHYNKVPFDLTGLSYNKQTIHSFKPINNVEPLITYYKGSKLLAVYLKVGKHDVYYTNTSANDKINENTTFEKFVTSGNRALTPELIREVLENIDKNGKLNYDKLLPDVKREFWRRNDIVFDLSRTPKLEDSYYDSSVTGGRIILIDHTPISDKHPRIKHIPPYPKFYIRGLRDGKGDSISVEGGFPTEPLEDFVVYYEKGDETYKDPLLITLKLDSSLDIPGGIKEYYISRTNDPTRWEKLTLGKTDFEDNEIKVILESIIGSKNRKLEVNNIDDSVKNKLTDITKDLVIKLTERFEHNRGEYESDSKRIPYKREEFRGYTMVRHAHNFPNFTVSEIKIRGGVISGNGVPSSGTNFQNLSVYYHDTSIQDPCLIYLLYNRYQRLWLKKYYGDKKWSILRFGIPQNDTDGEKIKALLKKLQIPNVTIDFSKPGDKAYEPRDNVLHFTIANVTVPDSNYHGLKHFGPRGTKFMVKEVVHDKILLYGIKSFDPLDSITAFFHGNNPTSEEDILLVELVTNVGSTYKYYFKETSGTKLWKELVRFGQESIPLTDGLLKAELDKQNCYRNHAHGLNISKKTTDGYLCTIGCKTQIAIRRRTVNGGYRRYTHYTATGHGGFRVRQVEYHGKILNVSSSLLIHRLVVYFSHIGTDAIPLLIKFEIQEKDKDGTDVYKYYERKTRHEEWTEFKREGKEHGKLLTKASLTDKLDELKRIHFPPIIIIQIEGRAAYPKSVPKGGSTVEVAKNTDISKGPPEGFTEYLHKAKNEDWKFFTLKQVNYESEKVNDFGELPIHEISSVSVFYSSKLERVTGKSGRPLLVKVTKHGSSRPDYYENTDEDEDKKWSKVSDELEEFSLKNKLELLHCKLNRPVEIEIANTTEGGYSQHLGKCKNGRVELKNTHGDQLKDYKVYEHHHRVRSTFNVSGFKKDGKSITLKGLEHKLPIFDATRVIVYACNDDPLLLYVPQAGEYKWFKKPAVGDKWENVVNQPDPTSYPEILKLLDTMESPCGPKKVIVNIKERPKNDAQQTSTYLSDGMDIKLTKKEDLSGKVPSGYVEYVHELPNGRKDFTLVATQYGIVPIEGIVSHKNVTSVSVFYWAALETAKEGRSKGRPILVKVATQEPGGPTNDVHYENTGLDDDKGWRRVIDGDGLKDLNKLQDKLDLLNCRLNKVVEIDVSKITEDTRSERYCHEAVGDKHVKRIKVSLLDTGNYLFNYRAYRHASKSRIVGSTFTISGFKKSDSTITLKGLEKELPILDITEVVVYFCDKDPLLIYIPQAREGKKWFKRSVDNNSDWILIPQKKVPDYGGDYEKILKILDSFCTSCGPKEVIIDIKERPGVGKLDYISKGGGTTKIKLSKNEDSSSKIPFGYVEYVHELLDSYNRNYFTLKGAHYDEFPIEGIGRTPKVSSVSVFYQEDLERQTELEKKGRPLLLKLIHNSGSIKWYENNGTPTNPNTRWVLSNEDLSTDGILKTRLDEFSCKLNGQVQDFCKKEIPIKSTSPKLKGPNADIPAVTRSNESEKGNSAPQEETEENGRAVRYEREHLSVDGPFLHTLVDSLVDTYGDVKTKEVDREDEKIKIQTKESLSSQHKSEFRGKTGYEFLGPILFGRNFEYHEFNSHTQVGYNSRTASRPENSVTTVFVNPERAITISPVYTRKSLGSETGLDTDLGQARDGSGRYPDEKDPNSILYRIKEDARNGDASDRKLLEKVLQKYHVGETRTSNVNNREPSVERSGVNHSLDTEESKEHSGRASEPQTYIAENHPVVTGITTQTPDHDKDIWKNIGNLVVTGVYGFVIARILGWYTLVSILEVALIPTLAIAHVLIDEIKASTYPYKQGEASSDLSDQVPDTESETKILLNESNNSQSGSTGIGVGISPGSGSGGSSDDGESKLKEDSPTTGGGKIEKESPGVKPSGSPLWVKTVGYIAGVLGIAIIALLGYRGRKLFYRMRKNL